MPFYFFLGGGVFRQWRSTILGTFPNLTARVETVGRQSAADQRGWGSVREVITIYLRSCVFAGLVEQPFRGIVDSSKDHWWSTLRVCKHMCLSKTATVFVTDWQVLTYLSWDNRSRGLLSRNLDKKPNTFTALWANCSLYRVQHLFHFLGQYSITIRGTFCISSLSTTLR